MPGPIIPYSYKYPYKIIAGKASYHEALLLYSYSCPTYLFIQYIHYNQNMYHPSHMSIYSHA